MLLIQKPASTTASLLLCTFHSIPEEENQLPYIIYCIKLSLNSLFCELMVVDGMCMDVCVCVILLFEQLL